MPVRGWGRVSVPPVSATRLRELYVEQGLSIRQVAQILDSTPDRVTTGLRAAGIAPRARGRHDGVQLAPITAEQLQELYVRQQLSAREIAEQLGGEQTRVLDALRREGIPVRPGGSPPGPRGPRVPQLHLGAAELGRLYVEDEFDDEQIGRRYGVSSWQVRRRRTELGVTRRPAEGRPAPPAEVLRRAYVDEQLWLKDIARRYHTRIDTVRRWLKAAGIPVRARPGRRNRLQPDPTLLRRLYHDEQWTAAEIAAELDINAKRVLRALHDNAIPVRVAGPRTRHEVAPTQLLRMLYADPQVRALLRRHHLPRRPQPGPIAERFPDPVPLTEALLREAYLDLGLAARQIELLTGHSTEHIIPALTEANITIRAGGRASPWLIRQWHGGS